MGGWNFGFGHGRESEKLGFNMSGGRTWLEWRRRVFENRNKVSDGVVIESMVIKIMVEMVLLNVCIFLFDI